MGLVERETATGLRYTYSLKLRFKLSGCEASPIDLKQSFKPILYNLQVNQVYRV